MRFVEVSGRTTVATIHACGGFNRLLSSGRSLRTRVQSGGTVYSNRMTGDCISPGRETANTGTFMLNQLS